MLFFENLFLAFSAIRSNKMRSMLTMLGIIIGIGAVITIVTVGNSLSNSIEGEMESIGGNNVTVGIQQRSSKEEFTESGMVFRDIRRQKTPEEKDLITEEMIYGLVEKYPEYFKGVAIEEGIGNGTVNIGSEYANIVIDGVNDGYFIANTVDLLAGNTFNNVAYEEGKGVCLVSDYFVNNLYDGDKSKAIGQTVEIELSNNGYKYYTYTIIGVYEYESSGFISSNEYDTPTTMYVPLKSATRKTHSKGFQQFTAIARSGVNYDELSTKIGNYFDLYYKKNDDFTISCFSLSSMISSFTSMLSTVSLAISVIAGISLVVGGIGVMNIMLVSISERTKEIGTRKALGATNGSIRLQFIMESIVLCLIGGAIGVAVGIIGGSLGAKALGYEAAPSVTSIIVSLVFSMGIGVFFGYYPANKAAKMNPIDALRYE